ncbi:hypothetical protein Adu01nite_83720 [Paractinoplanes durhamensis]|uniref:Uncharacterized protein n=1 Tax=Paractinoplanes durhamensis TaxID=113563 RepID=A0ABQ3ZB20_9ACTN|nr:hypothetical protein Adu01nite_83720 [Actinoplanes durhamensis]
MPAVLAGRLVPVGADPGVGAVDRPGGEGAAQHRVPLLDEAEGGRLDGDAGPAGGDRHQVPDRQTVAIEPDFYVHNSVT